MSDDLFMRMPMSMDFGEYVRPRTEWIVPVNYGGVMPRRADRIVTIVPPDPVSQSLLDDGWQMRHASTWKRPSVVEWEGGPIVIGRHPFCRLRVSEDFPDPSGLGNWRGDDDGGTAKEMTHVKVTAGTFVCGSATGGSWRVTLSPVGPIRWGDEWHRHDGGVILASRVDSGRYSDRLPTNRKRKRERAKARRRLRR